MGRRIQGVLLDMDGVVFDTETLALRMWKKTLEELGYAADEGFIKKFVGLDLEGAEELFAASLGTRAEYLAARGVRLGKTREYIEKYGVDIKEGLFELLRFLERERYSTALVTSTDSRRVMRYVAYSGVGRYIDCVVTGDMVKKRKPAPDLYVYACEELGLKPEKCLAVEDSPVGIEAARAAGVPVLMVPDLIEPTEKERRACEEILPSLRDVLEFLMKNNRSLQRRPNDD